MPKSKTTKNLKDNNNADYNFGISTVFIVFELVFLTYFLGKKGTNRL